MDATEPQSQSSWIARVLVTLACLAGAYLILVGLVYVVTLFGSGADFPPTWYWALTILVVVIDVAAMCYIFFQLIRVLVNKSAPTRLLRVAAVLVLILGTLNVTTAYMYSIIPMWDFQGALFDDLSWPGPGKISQDCKENTTRGMGQGDNSSLSDTPNTERPISFEEVKRIAAIPDWVTRYNETRGRTIVGWRGWIQDVTRHGYYSNPEHHLVTLLLRDPYTKESVGSDKAQAEAVVSYFLTSDLERLAVGQEVLVCGDLSDVSAITSTNDYLHISISRPVISPLPLPEALSTTQIPADFVLEYEVYGCGDGYACDEYKLRLDAEGNVTYEGLDNVPVTGTHTAQISKDEVRQLVFEMHRTGFLAINNLPNKLDKDPSGSTVIRTQMDGKSKTVVLPWRSRVWPASVTMVIGKIEEVSQLQQWVKMVKSP